MCFAPEADVFAGIAITAVAIDAARHYPSPRYAGLAALPAIFAAHTFASAFVWWGLRGEIPDGAYEAAKWFYLFIAFTLLPIYVPTSVALVEPPGWRRLGMFGLIAAGIFSGLDFFNGLLAGEGSAVACDLYVDYSVRSGSVWAGALYALSTCGAMLLSSHRLLAQWGVVNVAIISVLAVVSSRGLPSLWCFGAACTSFYVAWLFRGQRRVQLLEPEHDHHAPV